MKNLSRLPTPLLAIVIALLLVATACGSDSDTTEGSDANETTAASSGDGETTDDSETTGDSASLEGVDVDLFFDGALAEDVASVDCTLTNGSETTCYQITVAGYPSDAEVGPFCPDTISDTADEVGIWLDGEALYDLDGEFIVDLPNIYNDDQWQLHDDDGNVHVTDTQEAFEAAARPDVAAEYQNHCVEGAIEWLDNGEPITSTVVIPATPVTASTSAAAGTETRDSIGVTLNGVIIAEQAPVEAILGAYTIAAFDDCGGHINPFDGYHLHGATGCSETDGAVAEGETAMFGYAMDGYAIHSPFDESTEADAGLDACNGHTTDELAYRYHANQAQDNAVLSCFTGETAS